MKDFRPLMNCFIATAIITLFTVFVCVSVTGCDAQYPKDELTVNEQALEIETDDTNCVNPSKKTQRVGYVNCGCCNAHVLEWWKVRNDANTAWVNVCGKCYDAIENEGV